MRTEPRDEGAAAVEMALVTVVFLAILGFIGPLAVVYYEHVQIGRDAADVVRFASSRPLLDRTIGDSSTPCAGSCTVRAGFLPAANQIKLEATRGRTGKDVVTDVTKNQSDTANCPSGKRVTVTLTSTVNLGVFGAFIPNTTQAVSATATSCEE